MHNKKVYHQSEIQLYLKCGLAWMFRYVDGIISPPSAAMTLGSSVDVGASRNFSQKIETKTDLPLQEVLDAFDSDFEVRKVETDWKDEDPGEVKDVGAKLLKLHHSEIAPSVDPVAVQEKFHLELENTDFDLGGTVDIVSADGLVIDTKTSSKKYAEDSISKSLQPAIYDFAYEALRGKKAKGFRYDILVKTKSPQVQQIEAEVSKDDRDWLFQTIDSVHRGIEAGIAMPAPEGAYWCSKSWCAYGGLGICPKFRGKK